MKNTVKRNLQNDARMLMALPPHNTWSNILAYDGYFGVDCRNFWGAELFNKTCEIEIRKFKLELSK